MLTTIIHDPTTTVLICMAGAPLLAGLLLLVYSLCHAAKVADEQAERMVGNMREADKQAQANLNWLLSLKDK